MSNYSQGYSAYIVQYFVLDYYQQVSMECKNDAYGTYSSVQEAKSACDSDKRCWWVFDEFCDNSPYFSLCPNGDYLDRSGCIHFKTSN